MEKILTISIAAYNVENYIRKALDSLMDEQVIDDLEIFVVDDGGTDGTLEIAREYAEKYPQSVFCIHKENGGYGSTINFSIKMASGKYFRQLDGDDWFVKKNLKGFIDILKSTQADVVLTNSVKYYESDKRYTKGLEYNHLPEGEYAFEDSQLDTRFSMHTVTFRTSILKKHEKPLTEHSLYTDSEYMTYPLPYLKNVYIYHKNIYVYRIGREEQSFNVSSIRKHYKEMQNVFIHCLDTYKIIDASERVKRKVALEILCTKAKDIINFFLLMPVSRNIRNEIKDYINFVEKECPEVINRVRKNQRTLDILLRSHYLAYPLAGRRVKSRWGKAIDVRTLSDDEL